MILPIGGIGAIVMPYLIGVVAEHTGIYGGMLCILAMSIYAGFFFIDPQNRGCIS
ncbi:MAG: hypothetical protein LIO81_00390 [Clostridiales bacterium]|nr:hypothetical protein [Clostridiales bacterium]